MVALSYILLFSSVLMLISSQLDTKNMLVRCVALLLVVSSIWCVVNCESAKILLIYGTLPGCVLVASLLAREFNKGNSRPLK